MCVEEVGLRVVNCRIFNDEDVTETVTEGSAMSTINLSLSS